MMCKKSIFIIVLVILFMVSIIPVNAAAYEGNVVDLLSAASYFVGAGSDLTESDYPGGYSGGSTYFRILWDNDYQSRSFDYIYFNIRADKEITTVRFSDDGSSNLLIAERVGMYDSLYQYRIPCDGYIFEDFLLRIHFGSANGVNVLLESCYGVITDSVPISKCNVRAYNQYLINNQAAGTNFTQQSLYGTYNNTSIPFYLSIKDPFAGMPGYSWLLEADIIEIYARDLVYDSIGNVSLLFYSSDLNSITVSLNVGGFRETIPIEVNEMYSVEKAPDSGNGDFVPMTYFEVNFDLSGYDLTGPNTCLFIHLYSDISHIEQNASYTLPYTYWSLIGAFYEAYNPPVPWYQQFWNWLKGGLKDLGQSIVDGLSGSTKEQTEEILTGGDASQELTDGKDAIVDKNEQINDIEVGLTQSIPRPDVDLNAWISPLINYDSASLLLLSSVTGDVKVVSIMTIVMTFAFIGFVFFGKRG